MGSYIGGAYKQIYKHPNWKIEAQEYEKNLYSTLYHNTYVMQAAQTALSKVSTVLTAYFGEDGASGAQLENAKALSSGIAQLSAGKNDSVSQKAMEEYIGLDDDGYEEDGANEWDEQQDEKNKPISVNETLKRAFLNNDVSSAGQIGISEDEEVNTRNVDEVLNKNGNIREKMTMLFNATLFNAGMSKEQTQKSFTLKRLFNEISADNIKNNEAFSDFDMKSIKKLRKKDIFDTTKMIGALSKSSLKRRISAGMGYVSRQNKAAEDQVGMGYDYYKNEGFKLSKREKQFAASEKIDGKRQLSWKEGQAYISLKNSKWTKRKNKKGFQLLTGPSGTTMRMLGAYKMLGASQSDLLAFRLALIGWMGSGHDHSLYEILYGSHLVGVKGKEDISEAAKMYMTIDPLSTEQLRQFVARNYQFPHERIYAQMLDDIAEKRKIYHQNNIHISSLISGVLPDDEAQTKALNIYTTGAYRAMNMGQIVGEGLGWKLARMVTKDGTKGEGMFNHSSREEIKNKELAAQIRGNLRITSAIGQEALRERSHTEAYKGITYRGTGVMRGSRKFRKGNTFELSSLTSTSKDRGQAENFYRNVSKIFKPVLMICHLTGKSGLDIENISAITSEEEVLLPKGTVFRVINGVENKDRKNVVELEEVSGPADFSRRVESNAQITDSFINPIAYDNYNSDTADVVPAAPPASYKQDWVDHLNDDDMDDYNNIHEGFADELSDDNNETEVMASFTQYEKNNIINKLNDIKADSDGGMTMISQMSNISYIFNNVEKLAEKIFDSVKEKDKEKFLESLDFSDFEFAIKLPKYIKL